MDLSNVQNGHTVSAVMDDISLACRHSLARQRALLSNNVADVSVAPVERRAVPKSGPLLFELTFHTNPLVAIESLLTPFRSEPR